MNTRRFIFTVCSVMAYCLGYGQSETMLTGKIVDTKGSNLIGCHVRVCGCNKRDSADKDGVYRIYLHPGKYNLELYRADSLVSRQSVEIPPVEFYEVDFVVARKY